MPIYEFACDDCRKRFTDLRIVSRRDEPITCEACGSFNCRRLVSTSAIVVSGADRSFEYKIHSAIAKGNEEAAEARRKASDPDPYGTLERELGTPSYD